MIDPLPTCVSEMEPELVIRVQPKQRGFRFRYKCEGNTHGGLQGVTSYPGHKCYPSVEIINYNGPAHIIVTLVTNEDKPMLHVHELVGKNVRDGKCVVELSGDDMTAVFSNLGILHATKREVSAILKQRLVEQLKIADYLIGRNRSELEIEAEAKAMAKNQSKDMELNVARLSFQASLLDKNGRISCSLPAVYSHEIYDSKSPASATLKICRMDKHSGVCTGDEEIFLLCEKVQKGDIQVRFYEEDIDGEIRWEDYGKFNYPDVHYQFAIVFRTPAYYDVTIKESCMVFIQLRRLSDHQCSDSIEFRFTPVTMDENELHLKKRKFIQFDDGGGAHLDGLNVDNTDNLLLPSLLNFTVEGQSRQDQNPLLQNALDNITRMDLHAYLNDDASCPIPSKSMPLNVQAETSSHSNRDNVSSEKIRESDDGADEVWPSNNCNKKDKLRWNLQKKRQAETGMAAALNIAVRSLHALQSYSISGDPAFMLAVQRHLVSVPDKHGDTALHLSVIHEQDAALLNLVRAIRSLPEPKVFDARNAIGQTPLHIAVLTEQPLLVEYLLQAGASLAVCDKNGDQAIHLSLRNAKLLEIILNFTKERKIDINSCMQRNYKGMNPLHVAIREKKLHCLRMLVAAGANVESEDGLSGRTVLLYAVEMEDYKTTKYLLEDGLVDPDHATFSQLTPLSLARSMNNRAIVDLLLQYDASHCDDFEICGDVKNELKSQIETLGTKEVPECERASLKAGFASIDSGVACSVNTKNVAMPLKSKCRQDGGQQFSGDFGYASQCTLPSGSEAMASRRLHSPDDLAELDDRLDAMKLSDRSLSLSREKLAKIASILDKTRDQEKNWVKLANLLELQSLTRALEVQESPSNQLIRCFQEVSGDDQQLLEALSQLNNKEVDFHL